MRSRSLLWVLLALGVAAAVAVLLTRERAAVQAAPVAPWAPDPGPTAMTAASPASAAPAAAPAVPLEAAERPLPTWVRVAIVVAALLAFLAVSLIATKEA